MLMMVAVVGLMLCLGAINVRIHHWLQLDLLLDLLLLLLLMMVVMMVIMELLLLMMELLMMMVDPPPSSSSFFSPPSTNPHSLLYMHMAMRMDLPKEGMGQGISR